MLISGAHGLYSLLLLLLLFNVFFHQEEERGSTMSNRSKGFFKLYIYMYKLKNWCLVTQKDADPWSHYLLEPKRAPTQWISRNAIPMSSMMGRAFDLS